ncbi:CCAAT-binding factor subunit B [Encephalitozoon hellem]|nr:CCAAT-binding factor subunit B [Encephalitozoon hellem]
MKQVRKEIYKSFNKPVSMQHRDMMEQGASARYGDIEFDEGDLRDVRYPDKASYGAYDYSFPFNDQAFQPLYVNAKQLNWIKKRKARRDMLDTLMVTNKRNYLHESRHKHAMKRLRAPSGRFLTKEETEELNRKGGSTN